jgi:uncharacterized protein (DUF433 family)
MVDTTILTIEHIVRTPGVCGGEARIDGTRLPVWMLVAQIQSGATPDDLLAGYAHLALSRAQLYAALSYYYDHQPEIDRLIEANDQAFAEGQRETQSIRQSIAAGADLITAGEAADLLGLSRESYQVAHLCRDGILDCQKIANRWFITRESVTRYAESDRRPGPKSDG